MRKHHEGWEEATPDASYNISNCNIAVETMFELAKGRMVTSALLLLTSTKPSDCPLPPREPPAMIYCFTGRWQCFDLLLALVAEWIGRAHEKMMVWCSNSTEEFVNHILDVCGVQSHALLSRCGNAKKDKIINAIKTPLRSKTGAVVLNLTLRQRPRLRVN